MQSLPISYFTAVSFGGVASLFLGCSLVSIVEIIYVIYKTFLALSHKYHCDTCHGESSDSETPRHPFTNQTVFSTTLLLVRQYRSQSSCYSDIVTRQIYAYLNLGLSNKIIDIGARRYDTCFMLRNSTDHEVSNPCDNGILFYIFV